MRQDAAGASCQRQLPCGFQEKRFCMNLTIDQGNSSAKVSVFDGNDIVAVARFDLLSISALARIIKVYDVGAAAYSSVVRKPDARIMELLRKRVKRFICLDENTPLPVTIEYDTPHTLGHDRIAAAVGATTCAPGHDVLIVDAGTAVTLDIVTADCRFLGGNISPGLHMRFEALNNYTSRLPLVDCSGEVPLIGHDTVTAIRAGVVGGLVSEIESYIDKIAARMGDGLAVIFTGGDCKFLASQVSRKVMVVDNLLSIGLNRILSYNENI